METTENLKTLSHRLQKLEEAITETKRRLPAHSTKPPVMMDLLALEDEYHEVSSAIQALKKGK